MHPFTKRPAAAVSSLGEERLIAEIRRWLGNVSPRSPFGIGDDCAVLPATRGQQLITVDPVIYGRHFDDSIAPRDVGAKLLKRNLSDMAAMGGRPRAAVLALTLDANVSLKWLEGFYRGLAACAREYGVTIVGGDISQADRTVVASLTLLGEPDGGKMLTRTGGRRGDAIYVTGVLGGSRESGHHYQFRPRLREGAWLARTAGVRAMMDISDGLAKDLHAIVPHGARPFIEPKSVPRRAGASLRAALSDGEDFELLFVFDRSADAAAMERRWRRSFPRTRLTRIGEIVGKRDSLDGAVNFAALRGYEHLTRVRAGNR